MLRHAGSLILVSALPVSALSVLTLAVATLTLGTLAGCGGQDGIVAGDDGGSGGAGGGSGGSGSVVSSSGSGDSTLLKRLPGVEITGWQAVETDWCREGWLGLDEQTCFYLPASNPAPSGVMIFLHGMMPPDASSSGQQAIVEQAAEELGVLALFPRGRQGLCSWDASVMDWYCWPSSRQNVDLHAESFAEEWSAHTSLLEKLLAGSLTEHYVMGFSNGGYFASYIGLEGWWPVDGAGLVAAGRSFIDAQMLAEARPPIYVAVGALDSQSVQDSAQNLAYFLNQQSWPNQLVIHQGRGHEIWPDDIIAAAALWSAP